MRFWAVVAFLAIAVVGLPQSKPKPKLNDLKTDLKQIQGRKNTLRKQLSTTRRKVRAVRGDIHQIDNRIEKVSNSLENTQQRLADGVEEQARLKEELKLATKQLAKKLEQVKGRLRWMYVHQDRSVVTALVGAQDVSEIAARTALYERIARADRDLFEEFARLRDEVARKKKRQDELVKEIAQLKQRQLAQRAELKENRQDKKVVLAELWDKQEDLEKLIEELDREENSIEATIATYCATAGRTSGLKPFTGRFSRPVNGSITSRYGMRHHPILRRTRLHAGVDFGAGHGSRIMAAADGVVIAATYSRGYGNMIILDHGGGISTLYAHCSAISVSTGQRVKRGQRIGAVGSTGLATGPHLHFEVRVNGRPVNPLGKL